MGVLLLDGVGVGASLGGIHDLVSKAKLIGDRKTSTTQRSHPSSSSDDGPPTTSRSTTSPSKTTWPAPTDTPSTSHTLAADTRLNDSERRSAQSSSDSSTRS